MGKENKLDYLLYQVEFYLKGAADHADLMERCYKLQAFLLEEIMGSPEEKA